MKITVMLLMIILFSIPAVSVAEGTEETYDTEMAQAVSDAERDADLYGAFSWGTGSCLASGICVGIGGIFVLVYSQLSEVKPPPERLLGKTPIYVTVYQSTYQEKVKRKRLKYGTVGWLAGTAIGASVGGYITLKFFEAMVEAVLEALFEGCSLGLD